MVVSVRCVLHSYRGEVLGGEEATALTCHKRSHPEDVISFLKFSKRYSECAVFG